MTASCCDTGTFDVVRLRMDALSADAARAGTAHECLLAMARSVAGATIRRTIGDRYLSGMDWTDGVQETLFRVTRCLETCEAQTPAEFGAWVRTIASRTAYQLVARAHRESQHLALSQTHADPLVSDRSSVEALIWPDDCDPIDLPSTLTAQLRALGSISGDAEALLRALRPCRQTQLLLFALSRVTRNQRRVLFLRVAQQLSWPEVARRLRTTTGAVRRRYRRAIDTLRRLTRGMVEH